MILTTDTAPAPAPGQPALCRIATLAWPLGLSRHKTCFPLSAQTQLAINHKLATHQPLGAAARAVTLCRLSSTGPHLITESRV